jgi:hypothetical protein
LAALIGLAQLDQAPSDPLPSPARALTGASRERLDRAKTPHSRDLGRYDRNRVFAFEVWLRSATSRDHDSI